MSDRKDNGDTTNASTPQAYYTLEVDVSGGREINTKVESVKHHSLRSGFLVIETAYGEYWFRASDVSRLKKY